MMHDEYQHFVDYGSTADRVPNPFNVAFISSSVDALDRPSSTTVSQITLLPNSEVKLEPQHVIHDNKSEVSKSFKCYQCGYSTSLKSNLNQHITCVHATVKPFKCSLCSYAAAIKSNLNQHVQCVHVKTKPFKYSSL